MSELLTTIKKEQLMARKAKDSVRATLLTTLIGEASPSGKESTTDEKVKAVIGRFYKNLRDNREDYLKRNQDVSQVDAEMRILEEFMPKQLSENEIQTMVDSLVKEHGLTDMKGMQVVMKHFNQQYEGQFDGKTVKACLIKALKS